MKDYEIGNMFREWVKSNNLIVGFSETGKDEFGCCKVRNMREALFDFGYEAFKAALQLSESAKTVAQQSLSSSQGSPKLPSSKNIVEKVKEWYETIPDCMPNPTPEEIVKVTYDFIVEIGNFT